MVAELEADQLGFGVVREFVCVVVDVIDIDGCHIDDIVWNFDVKKPHCLVSGRVLEESNLTPCLREGWLVLLEIRRW